MDVRRRNWIPGTVLPRRIRPVAAILAAMCLSASADTVASECKLARLAELPVTMNGTQPIVTAQINGTDALFTLDSGAWWSLLTTAAAAQYNLHPSRNRVPGLYLLGVGGRVDAAVATVDTFTIFNLPLHKMDFIVGGTDVGQGSAGLIGQNILRIADIEYDLAQGAIRFFKATDCKGTPLAYWLKPGSVYSPLDLERATPLSPHIVGAGYLNGAKIRITFDTGAARSIVATRAAAKAGIKPGGAGVEPAGASMGLGRQFVQTWIANFPSLKIGDEEIHNARLRFGELGETDMLLGADFFLSHRIYVARGQNKLFFSYNGGPVFDLTVQPKSGPAPDKTPVESGAAAAATPGAAGDAAEYARRGAALAARHDFEHALQEFDRACELAPGEASYHYQRAMARFGSQQLEPASSDIDQALKLKPDYVDALLVRARLRMANKDTASAIADLDAADRAAPKEADIRLALSDLYVDADRRHEAIAQLDYWIPVHPQDARLAHALNDRCWQRAILGAELDRALDDCNAALRLQPYSAQILDSRGLVYLRKGDFDKSIADYNASLKTQPGQAWSLYGRGIAKLRKGRTAEGQADLASAAAIVPDIAEHAGRHGIAP